MVTPPLFFFFTSFQDFGAINGSNQLLEWLQPISVLCYQIKTILTPALFFMFLLSSSRHFSAISSVFTTHRKAISLHHLGFLPRYPSAIRFSCKLLHSMSKLSRFMFCFHNLWQTMLNFCKKKTFTKRVFWFFGFLFSF